MGMVLSELPISNQKFFGRVSELQKIHEALNASSLEQKGVVLWGLGGSGKSRLALRYLELNQDKYTTILWINAMSQESIDESLSQIVLRIKDLEHTYRNSRAEEKNWSFVRRWLTTASNNDWLMVVDSVDDLERVDFKQLIPQCNHGKIIVTSTQSHLAKKLDWRGVEIASIGVDAGSQMLLSNASFSVDMKTGE